MASTRTQEIVPISREIAFNTVSKTETRMGPLDKTSMGGKGSRFETTHWSQIRHARTDDNTRRMTVVGNLMKGYWRPVYSYLIRKGYGNEEAKDLTQGFFHEVVLGRGLIQRADEAKGRFRTLLLTALDRYVAEVHRRETRKKRRPEGGVVQVESDELVNLVAAQTETKPEEAFYRTWATDLLDQVLVEVKEEYCSTKRASHWAVFDARILAPILGDSAPPPLAKVCKEYGIADEATASNMIITVKRRFRAVLRRHLRRFVQSDSQVEEEFMDIRKILSKSRAG